MIDIYPGMSREQFDQKIAELGGHLARFADDAEREIKAMGIDPPKRCASCAFTAGTYPNTKAPATALDALKCVIENHPFGCHHEKGPDGLPTKLCAGYLMITALEKKPQTEAPWKFSDEILKERSNDRNTDPNGSEERRDG